MVACIPFLETPTIAEWPPAVNPLSFEGTLSNTKMNEVPSCPIEGVRKRTVWGLFTKRPVGNGPYKGPSPLSHSNGFLRYTMESLNSATLLLAIRALGMAARSKPPAESRLAPFGGRKKC